MVRKGATEGRTFMGIPVHILVALSLLACAPPIGRDDSQAIVARPVAKAPPSVTPGGGVQVDVYNRTPRPHQLRVRAPGGNWYVFTISPNGGRNLRCTACTSHFEASVADTSAAPVLLTPGTEYEILLGDGPGNLLLRARGDAGGLR